MIDAEEAFHTYHRELLTRLDAARDELDSSGEDAVVDAIGRLTTLAQDFVRYVEANEGWLYPAVEPLVRADGQVMAPMMFDVRAIEDYAADGEELGLETPSASVDGGHSRDRRLRLLAARFDAVIRLHLEKLERIYLPMLSELRPEERRAIVEGMAAEYEPRPEWPEGASAGA
jgi:hypothetical protein